MSFLPFCVEMESPPTSLFEQQLLSIAPDLLRFLEQRSPRNYFRALPLKQSSSVSRDPAAGSTVRLDKNKFQIHLDVQHFAPDDVSVKTSDGFLIIEGRHEEKQDPHGFISRQFKRRYQLPEGCNIDAVESRLSSDGVLVVTAPLTRAAANERVVPILQTGPVRIRLEPSVEAGDAEPAETETVENGQ